MYANFAKQIREKKSLFDELNGGAINIMEVLKLKLNQERKLSKAKNDEKGFTLIELTIVIVILGIISGVAVPRFSGLSDSARLSAARGVGGAMHSTITASHADYLVNANDYTATDVINDSLFAGGAATPTVAGNVITWISGSSTYTWTYTPRNGADSAYLIENSSSAFP